MVQPTKDPTLTAFHEPKTEAECIYFAAYCTETGDLQMTRVVCPATFDPAPLRIDLSELTVKDGERHAA